ncbi:GDSL-type esterase/lipase family protein [Niallia taxi]|uniref:GDSL-type esterase/lipase family protein n=1 Tax=Niallia taxi TaxID=2499688 RepID=UPI002E211EF5|nr:GDSL-type esterase/lipase family protein [Niallia taxi]MED4118302.1 GDSL-type esterase/lipase family protein [Niallia taxi]
MRKKVILILFLLVVLILIMFLGQIIFNFKMNNLYENENFSVAKKTASTFIDGDLVTRDKTSWIDSALNKNEINNPHETISEAEFLVLLFKIYNQAPSIVDTSKHWAESYYKGASNLHYTTWDRDQRDEPITIVHSSELITAIQGEKLKGNQAIDYVFRNGILDKNFKNHPKLTITREQAVDLVKNVFESGFYLFQPIDNDEKNVLVSLGDSISLGWNLGTIDSASNKGFPNLIQQYDKKYEVYNLAYKGMKTEELIKKLNKPMYQNKINRANNITLQIGSANLLRGALSYLTEVKNNNNILPTSQQKTKIEQEAEQVKTDIYEIIKSIRKLTDAPIYLYGLYNPIPSNVLGSKYSDSIIKDINLSIKGISLKNNNIYYIDCFKYFKGKEQLYVIEGDIHPTYKGQKLLAELYLNKVKELNKNIK